MSYLKIAGASLLALTVLQTACAHTGEGEEHDAEHATGESDHIYYSPGDIEAVQRRGNESIFILTGEDTEGRYSLVHETFNPGMDSYPGHSHHRHSEVFYIISGQMQFTVSGETRVLGGGELIYIPPGAAHASKVLGDEPVVALMLYEPGGYENNYFGRQALTEEMLADKNFMEKWMKITDFDPIMEGDIDAVD